MTCEFLCGAMFELLSKLWYRWYRYFMTSLYNDGSNWSIIIASHFLAVNKWRLVTRERWKPCENHGASWEKNNWIFLNTSQKAALLTFFCAEKKENTSLLRIIDGRVKSWVFFSNQNSTEEKVSQSLRWSEDYKVWSTKIAPGNGGVTARD